MYIFNRSEINLVFQEMQTARDGRMDGQMGKPIPSTGGGWKVLFHHTHT